MADAEAAGKSSVAGRLEKELHIYDQEVKAFDRKRDQLAPAKRDKFDREQEIRAAETADELRAAYRKSQGRNYSAI
jgi:hypothetical protein